jgi:hypothetical protein
LPSCLQTIIFPISAFHIVGIAGMNNSTWPIFSLLKIIIKCIIITSTFWKIYKTLLLWKFGLKSTKKAELLKSVLNEMYVLLFIYLFIYLFEMLEMELNVLCMLAISLS